MEWLDYRQFNLGLEHVPDLILLATDLSLLTNSDENDSCGWGPVHAWRALAQLRAAEAIDPLLNLFHALPDNDWVIEEMPDVFALIGPSAFMSLAAYLADQTRPTYARLVAATSLMQMALLAPEIRDRSVAALTEQLQNYKTNSPGVNSVLIANLVELQAVEHSALIHRVFVESKVDRFIVGDWRDVRLLLAHNGRVTTRCDASALTASIKKVPPDPGDQPGNANSLPSATAEPRTQPRASLEPLTQPRSTSA
jgi:hypothetical protein